MEVVAEHVARLQEDLRAVEARAHRDHQDAVAGAQAQIVAATRWVEKTGLNAAILKIIDEIRPWHAWIKRDDFRTLVPPDLYDVVATRWTVPPTYPGDRRETTRAEMRLEPGGARYAVEFTQWTSAAPDGGPVGEARIFEDDELRLTIALHATVSRYSNGYEWSTYQPSVLVPGDWATAVVVIAHRMRQFFAQRMRASEADRLTKQAAGLPSLGTLP